MVEEEERRQTVEEGVKVESGRGGGDGGREEGREGKGREQWKGREERNELSE